MDFITPLLACFNTCVISPMGAKFQVFRNFGENIKELETARDYLVVRRDGQRGKVEEEKKQQGVEESPEAKLWFTQVDGSLSEVNNLLSDVYNTLQNQNEQTFCNCFCWSRYQLSKRVLKHKQDVVKLYEFADPKSGWTAAPAAQKGKKLDTIYSIRSQTTTEKLKHEIIDAVLDDRYLVVGLCGMGGIGKTTLLRHVNNHFSKTEHFQSVIFTTISATPNFVELRKQIAQSLELRDCQDDDDVKEKLSRHFSATGIGKYLLILDDMWQPIDLGEICIPAPKKESGCKILMASRSRSVATRFVAARDSLQLIPVNILPAEEAWNLFVQKVGTAITSKPEIEPLAKKVLRKCDGLPLAIIVVGGTMSTRETEGEWKDALRELDQSASNLEGIEEEVFSILIFSFEKLQPIEQSLFLYCCLFPEDYSITKEFLLDFAIGEETLLCDEMHRLGDMRNKVDVLVAKLRNSSMLEDGDESETIKMHDVMRELGMWITSPKSNKYHSKFIAKARARITEAPKASEWHEATKISLMYNEIESLPGQLPDSCPQLHTLLLHENRRIKEIPQVHFLEHMPSLRILDLSYCTRLRNLPPSISHLVNLRLLCLRSCTNLQELPPEIGMLVQLIMLDLWGCESLRMLPVGMKELKILRVLNLELTHQLKKIPRGVLSGLHKLEVLETIGSGLKWYPNAIDELSQLTCLTTIWISEIRKVEVSHWFKPLAICMWNLHLRNCAIDPTFLPDLLEDSTNFLRDVKFMSCRGLTCVPTRGCTWLLVRRCPDLKTLLSVGKSTRNAFESLCELELDRLHQFETICTGVPQLGCFSNLEKIKIHACPNLEVLFTNGVTPLLKKLRVLHVCRCSQLVKLVSDEDLEIDDAFPSLEKIRIEACHNLTVLFTNGVTRLLKNLRELRVVRCSQLMKLVSDDDLEIDDAFPSLEEIEIVACPNLKVLFTNGVTRLLKNLRVLYVYQCTQLVKLVSDADLEIDDAFPSLEELIIGVCPHLKVLFTNGVTWPLKKLRELHVLRCSQLVKLVPDEDLEIDAFPSLERISLCELPELTTICHLDLNWPSLSTAHVYLCPKLRRPPFGTQRADIPLNDEMDNHMTQNYLNGRRELEEWKKEMEEKDDDDDDDDDKEEEEEEEEEEAKGSTSS